MYTFRETPADHVIGQKPEQFCHWLFACAGLQAGDEVTDLYPGSGVVSRAWQTYEPGPTISDGYAGRER